MPSLETPDRHAASCLERLQKWRTRGRTFRSLHRSRSIYFGGCRPRIHYGPGAIGATTSAITLLDAAAINYFIATRACAENDGLNVFGCGRLVAGIGYLRLPASRTSGCTGSPDVSS